MQFSEISLFYIFIHEGTIEMSPEMGPSMVFVLVSPLEAIISTCMLVKIWTLLVYQHEKTAISAENQT